MNDSNDDHKDDDPIIIKPRLLAGIIVLSAVIGGVAGYLLCEFIESGETDPPPSVEAVR